MYSFGTFEEISNLFSMFHDGSIRNVELENDSIVLIVDIQMLAEHFQEEFKYFSVKLFGVESFQLEISPCDPEAPAQLLSTINEIAKYEIEILDGRVTQDVVEVIGVYDTDCSPFPYRSIPANLLFKCSHVLVFDEAGQPASKEQLIYACEQSVL